MLKGCPNVNSKYNIHGHNPLCEIHCNDQGLCELLKYNGLVMGLIAFKDI